MLGQHDRKIIFSSVVVVFLLSACSASQESSTTTQGTTSADGPKEKSALAVYEAAFHPSDYDEEVEAAAKLVPDGEEEHDIDAQAEEMSLDEQIVQGFRIQIFASAKIDEANLAKQTATDAFATDSVYIVYDPPVYKVRVGDYVTRFDANRALASIIQRGYPDAWIVTDQIIKRTLKRIPREEE